MSIMTYIGNKANILSETPEHARLVKMTRPVLTDDEMRRIRNIPEFPARTLSMWQPIPSPKSPSSDPPGPPAG